MSGEVKQENNAGWLTGLVYISIVSIAAFLIYAFVSLGFLLNSTKSKANLNFSVEQKILAEEGMELMAENGCNSCHLQNLTSDGPSFQEISQKYSVNDIGYLSGRVKFGGSSVWGKGPKEPSPDIEISDIDKMVYGILAQPSRNAELENNDVKYGILSFISGSPVISFLIRLLVLFAVGTAVMIAAAYLLTTERFSEIGQSLIRFFNDRQYRGILKTLLVLVPFFVAFLIYLNVSAGYTPPVFDRAVQVKPPESIMFKGSKVEIAEGENPLRVIKEKSPDKYREHIIKGRKVYYQNCVPCHGPAMLGDGDFAHGFNPEPSKFAIPGILNKRTETYLFWRIAKGPQLPAEAGPWSSSMPSFEDFLSEEEIWEVILYMYDFTGFEPKRN